MNIAGIIVVMLYNCFMVGCLTYIATYFDKWWIVLFSYFLLMKYSAENKAERTTESKKSKEADNGY